VDLELELGSGLPALGLRFFFSPVAILIHYIRLNYEYANAGDLLDADGAYGKKWRKSN
jgi:hypothetical protein